MTTIDDRSTIEKNVCLPSNQTNFYVPQQLIEANELLKSINRRLEDCALEWQAEISHKQWKIFNSKIIGGTLSEQSLLSRTYFTEKNLDEAFKHLLSYLLRREMSTSKVKETFDVQNQCCNTSENCKILSNINTEPMQSSSTNHEHLKGRKTEDYINNILTVQNSFMDVIKAKVNFDTKFLGFEAILHKTTSTTSDTICLCQYCSDLLQTTDDKNKKLKNITGKQRRRTVTRTKRLTRSSKALSRKRNKEKSPIIIGDVGDQPLFGNNANFC
ncbi:hypothetical protein ANTPLA_LOCUS8047 [Anthophora plagiata]